MPRAAKPDLIGRTIAGKYRIESAIGGGAMGSIYRARHVVLSKDVALKILHREFLFDEKFSTRFHREAQAASQLEHPNTTRVLDFGAEPDGLLYLAMELVDGRDLHELMNEDWPMRRERIAGIVTQVLAALAAAHRAGVIHRDIKPENVLVVPGLDDEGRPADIVKVCDFGIARLAAPEVSLEERAGPRLTSEGFVLGTPEYMSPEQAVGKIADERSDIYAMGVVLYQMLTGRRPFEGDTALAILNKHAHEAPRNPREIAPLADAGLCAVCLRALRKDPAERYQSATEMRAAIKETLDGKIDGQPASSSAPPSSHGAALETRARVETIPPRRGRRAAIAVLAVVVAGGAAAGAVRLARGRAPETTASAATGTPAADSAARSETNLAVAASSSATTRAPNPAATSLAVSDPVAARSDPTPTRARVGSTRSHPKHPGRRAQSDAPPIARGFPEDPPPDPAPAPPPSPVAPAPVAPPYDPASAHVALDVTGSTGGVRKGEVKAAIDRLAGDFTRCYRAALAAKGAPVGGSVAIKLRIDDSGAVSGRVGAAFLPALGACMQASLTHIGHIQGADTGDADADVVVVMTP